MRLAPSSYTYNPILLNYTSAVGSEGLFLKTTRGRKGESSNWVIGWFGSKGGCGFSYLLQQINAERVALLEVPLGMSCQHRGIVQKRGLGGRKERRNSKILY